ncbi:MAG: TIGR03013 family PEP-CTERM/XrtA system glycosyltransferase [Gammaproteobacteria bacterium]|nr:TIGR03013 family PEP-CTERM/XrtA system glycosyltransferase [Gammaproteobacteria bacterium]
MSIRIFSHYLHLPIVLLAVADWVVLFLALYLANALLPYFDPDESHWRPALVFSTLSFIALLSLGVYRSSQRFLFTGSLLRAFAGILLGGAGSALVFYLAPSWSIDRIHLLLGGALALVGTALLRGIFYRVIDEDLFKRNVLVYGSGVRAASIAQLRRRSDQRGFHLHGYVRAEGDQEVAHAEQILSINGSLIDYALANSIDEIIVAVDDRRQDFPIKDLLDCRLQGIEIVELVSFLEREAGKVALNVLNPSWLILSGGFRKSLWVKFAGRTLDLITSFLIILLTWPLMLLCIITILIEDGPGSTVIYRQRRVGLEGKLFDLLKFRSMREDAETDGGARWATVNDSRVTRVGSLIRRLRLDELPQVFNVLKGDMSFVGPRPERPEFVSRLNETIPYYRERHCVKPGITGWAQLCYPYGSSQKDALEKLQFDLYYVKNHNLTFDLMILLQTAEVIFLGKGAR